jgi:CRISPR-associated DxTHG motif protein
VKIPQGLSEEELWGAFEAITRVVEHDSDVIFDITHGFRSLPFMSFLAVAYLRKVKNVKVNHILYGQFETKEEGVVPVIDMAPLLKLLDWTVAADKFTTTGNGYELARLLDAQTKPELKGIRENIEQISQALHLLRPRDVMEQASQLEGHVENCANTLRNEPAFQQILNQVRERYGNLALPSNEQEGVEFVGKLLEQVEWYLEKRQYVQCIALAREWMVTLMCVQFGLDFEKDMNRSKVMLITGSNPKDDAQNGLLEIRTIWEQFDTRCKKTICKIWLEPYNLRNLRNDLIHTGFNRLNPADANIAAVNIEKIVHEMSKLHERWMGLTE